MFEGLNFLKYNRAYSSTQMHKLLKAVKVKKCVYVILKLSLKYYDE